MSDDTLSRLRGELDTIDRELIGLAARRKALVRQIGAAKGGSGKPIFDRARERAVYERAERLAAEAGLPPRVGRRLLEPLVESSHAVQSADAAAAATPRRILIVGGGGQMGRLLGGALAGRGHTIDVLERRDGRDRVAATRAAEIVILAVPMSAAEAVARELGPHVRPDALLCDINSLKAGICDAMARSAAGEVLGTHPMFGPTVGSLRRQKVVLCPVRSGPLSTALAGELGALGMEIIEADPRTHDRMMAVVQVLVHFSTLVMGDALRRVGVDVRESLAFTSPIYRMELAFTGRLFAQDPDLYAEIEMSNPEGPAVRREFLAAAAELQAIADAGDRAAFRARFRAVSDWFGGFDDEAMALSDLVIDALVRRP